MSPATFNAVMNGNIMDLYKPGDVPTEAVEDLIQQYYQLGLLEIRTEVK